MSAGSSGSTGGPKPTKTEQSLFEEDDEFEEFPAEGDCVGGFFAAFF